MSARSTSSHDSGYISSGTSQPQPHPPPEQNYRRSNYMPSSSPVLVTPANSLHSNDSRYRSSPAFTQPRELNSEERDAAWELLQHKKSCDQCQNLSKTYATFDRLCSKGNVLTEEANLLLRMHILVVQPYPQPRLLEVVLKITRDLVEPTCEYC